MAYAEAGADVLYAPGLTTREQISEVVHAVAPRPVNVLVGSPNLRLGLEELAELGVKRVSVGSTLARVAYGAFFRAAEELRSGNPAAMGQAMPFDRLNDLFR
ncbi:Oxaloacetate decarboxylase [compost metagenome]